MKLIAFLTIATALAVLGAQNTQSVTFHFFMWELRAVPVVAALFAALLVGALLGWMVTAPGRFRGMRRRRALEHEVATAQQRTVAAVSEQEESRAEARQAKRDLEQSEEETGDLHAGPPRA